MISVCSNNRVLCKIFALISQKLHIFQSFPRCVFTKWKWNRHQKCDVAVTLSSMWSPRFIAAAFHWVQRQIYCLNVNMFFVVEETNNFWIRCKMPRFYIVNWSVKGISLERVLKRSFNGKKFNCRCDEEVVIKARPTSLNEKSFGSIYPWHIFNFKSETWQFDWRLTVWWLNILKAYDSRHFVTKKTAWFFQFFCIFRITEWLITRWINFCPF